MGKGEERDGKEGSRRGRVRGERKEGDGKGERGRGDRE